MTWTKTHLRNIMPYTYNEAEHKRYKELYSDYGQVEGWTEVDHDCGCVDLTYYKEEYGLTNDPHEPRRWSKHHTTIRCAVH